MAVRKTMPSRRCRRGWRRSTRCNRPKLRFWDCLLTVPNAKNLPLELKAGSIIGGGHLGWVLVVAYSVLFAVAASIALIVLSALAAVPSAKVTDALSATKSTLIRHNAAIMTVLFLMLAALELSHVVEALSK